MTEEKKEEIAVIEITEEYMKNRLYEFRGKKVMLDSDLAEIYGYETQNFKRQVKNNIAKFEGDDFMFELNDEEVENLSRCKNFTLNMGRGSNIKYKDEVSYVLVFKLSRFGRHAADVLATLQVMQDFGVNLIGVEDGTLLVVFLDNTNCDYRINKEPFAAKILNEM